MKVTAAGHSEFVILLEESAHFDVEFAGLLFCSCHLCFLTRSRTSHANT